MTPLARKYVNITVPDTWHDKGRGDKPDIYLIDEPSKGRRHRIEARIKDVQVHPDKSVSYVYGGPMTTYGPHSNHGGGSDV